MDLNEDVNLREKQIYFIFTYLFHDVLETMAEEFCSGYKNTKRKRSSHLDDQADVQFNLNCVTKKRQQYSQFMQPKAEAYGPQSGLIAAHSYNKFYQHMVGEKGFFKSWRHT